MCHQQIATRDKIFQRLNRRSTTIWRDNHCKDKQMECVSVGDRVEADFNIVTNYHYSSSSAAIKEFRRFVLHLSVNMCSPMRWASVNVFRWIIFHFECRISLFSLLCVGNVCDRHAHSYVLFVRQSIGYRKTSNVCWSRQQNYNLQQNKNYSSDNEILSHAYFRL